MVKLAERKPVLDQGLPLDVRVWDDMGCVEQFLVLEAAEGALTPVGCKHALPKRSLMESLADNCGHITPPTLCCFVHLHRSWDLITVEPDVVRIVNGHRKGEIGRVVSDHEYGPRSQVLPWHNPMEVD